jgi:bifunctional polynucleotide phosphatase/kinase
MLNIKQKDTCYYFLSNAEANPTKIAAFDLDETIITTNSKNTFAEDENDWTWYYPNIPKKLKSLSDDGYHIVFFTNQKGLSSGKTELTSFSNKLTQIVAQLPPIDIFISSEDDYYRKPMTGMWQLFTSLYPNSNISKIDSFYCGDAAGRPKDWNGCKGRPKDFSSSDRYFANNLGLTFQIPEGFFLKGKDIDLPELPPHPLSLITTNDNEIDSLSQEINVILHQKRPILLLMVGPPATGKTTISKNLELIFGLLRINQDTLKTSAKCIKATKDAIKSRENIVIDNTNASVSGRKQYLDLIKDTDYIAVAMDIQVPKELANHLNYYRVETSKGTIVKIPSVVYNVFYKRYEKPTLEEGFSKILEMPFTLNSGASPEIKFYY